MSPVEIDRNGDVRLIAGRRFAKPGSAENGLGVEADDPRLRAGGILHASTHVDGGSDEIVAPLDPRAYPITYDTIANRPGAIVYGVGLFYASDEGILYRSNGASWVKLAVKEYEDLTGFPKVEQGALASRPAAVIGNAGRLYYSSDVDILSINGPAGSWEDVAPAVLHASTHSDGGADEIVSALDPRAYPLLADVIANRPAATIANAGRMFWSTDEHILYRNSGSGTWDKIAVNDARDLDELQIVLQAADTAAESAGTLSNTDLIFSFEANSVYVIDLYLIFSTGATTTGLKLAWDTNVAVNTAAIAFAHVLANTGTLTGGDAVADDTARGISSGANSINATTPLLAQGLLIAGANAGTARLRYAAEVSGIGGVKILAKSVMRAMRVA